MSVIVKPIITEKMSNLEEKLGRYGFIVENSANKVQIKKDVEATYGVTVESVNTMRYAGKAKRNRKTWAMDGRTSSFKKAIVTLKEGEVIDIYGNI
ncbi:MAG: 50S ribosomal protein L23 [Flavobacteriales bacterium]|jgi:large subunit ribosomal protein L23|nr:50S ribosomal protein L23 [Chitinophagales bacterium]|tara:strand:- start:428 stop:715 length:288 start_codon:yes stop_codon:yes gene_type:complete